MRTVVFFNNKGGVGKTTLACNIASFMATELQKRVLLVDCDPQCNSTQLVLDDNRWMPMYGADGSDEQTLRDVLRPLEQGDSSIERNVEPIKSSENRFGVDLLPGHPRLSILEDNLSQAWSLGSGGDIGGIRRTNWVSAMAKVYESRYDVLFFDVGPSLGSLNRTVLLGSDFFVTPMGADIFSIVGVRNIADWLSNWLEVYSVGLRLCDDRHPDSLEQFNINRTPRISKGFAGYTVQQYITKSKQGVRRPTQAFEAILSGMPDQIKESLGPFTASGLDAETIKLGDVPNMYSLIPLAQSVNVPISGLRSSDGLAGGQFQQQKNYERTIRHVGDALARNIGV